MRTTPVDVNGNFGIKKGRVKSTCIKCKKTIQKERIISLNKKLGLESEFNLFPA